MENDNMNSRISFYGVKALVYLKFLDNIEELSSMVSKGLELPNIIISNNEEHPYDLYGRCECLGFEIWLNKTSYVEDFSFKIEIATQDCIEEVFYNKMHDVSPWLSRYISRMCSIDTCFYDDMGKRNIFFKDGQIINL